MQSTKSENGADQATLKALATAKCLISITCGAVPSSITKLHNLSLATQCQRIHLCLGRTALTPLRQNQARDDRVTHSSGLFLSLLKPYTNVPHGNVLTKTHGLDKSKNLHYYRYCLMAYQYGGFKEVGRFITCYRQASQSVVTKKSFPRVVRCAQQCVVNTKRIFRSGHSLKSENLSTVYNTPTHWL